MKSLLNLLLLILFAWSDALAQDVPRRLDSLFASLLGLHQINGTVLVAEKGNVVYKKSLGVADNSSGRHNNDSSEFTLGSVSKTITSVAILQLKEAKKLQLDDHIVKFFPDLPYPDITIRHLLSHTSGLPDYDLYQDEMAAHPDKIFTNKDILPSLRAWKQPLHFKAGDRWEYVNTNFCLLALLVEKISGITFQKYAARRIFEPASMSHTYFQADARKQINTNTTINYEYPWLFSTAMEPADSIKRNHWRSYNASGFVGQGNIMTTAGDMLKFDDALYSGVLLKPATLEEAFTPSRLNNGERTDATTGTGKASYGLGWFIFDDTSQGKIVWHSGGVPGGLSIFMRNIPKRQTVIAFDNEFDKGLYKDGVNAMNILNERPVLATRISPVRLYADTLLHYGADAAFCALMEMNDDTLHYHLDEDDLNELGLQLLYAATFKQHTNLALEVLKLNTLLFPKGFNTYDSYGEALASIGKREDAVYMYKKSLQLNPASESGKQALEKLLTK
jgi:CubicO group peptidase (beta-lactamase class C family)